MELPYLTHDIPGLGGTIKATPEDFVVDEVPLYPFSGEGNHVLFKLKKRGMSTFDAVRKIARTMRLPEDAFSYAGMKDKQAVTTQWLSLEYGDVPLIESLDIEGLEVLEVTRHQNKLKVGHLAGNRFRLRIRDIDESATDAARQTLARLVERGVPNFFDRQRFGLLKNSHIVGKAIVHDDPELLAANILGDGEGVDERFDAALAHYRAGDHGAAAEALPGLFTVEKRYLAVLGRTKNPRKAMASIQGKRRRFFVSAYQGWLFNRLLIDRIEAIDTIELGDIAWLHRNGAVFRVDDIEHRDEEGRSLAERAAAFDISPSGPVYGTQLMLATHRPGEGEAALLEAERLELGAFDLKGGLRSRGVRRPYRFRIETPTLAFADGVAELAFTLPKGSYATLVLREITKNDDPLELVEPER